MMLTVLACLLPLSLHGLECKDGADCMHMELLQRKMDIEQPPDSDDPPDGPPGMADPPDGPKTEKAYPDPAELQTPKQVYNDGQVIPLTISADVPYPVIGFKTFGYNGSVPGPTIHVKPGESLIIEVHNAIPAGGLKCDDEAAIGEAECDTDSTNLHTHGLHVSPQSQTEVKNVWADDVIAKIKSGMSGKFQVTLPANHMPGTHLYHPHVHHATLLQTAGGAAGMLIVPDPPGYLPEAYAQMPEKQIIMLTANWERMPKYASKAQYSIYEDAFELMLKAGRPLVSLLVNGQEFPQITMSSHTWYRFRILFVSLDQAYKFFASNDGNGTCSVQLMAKDGIYLETMPRPIGAVHLASGNRADVAVSCQCETYPCVVTVNAEEEGTNNGVVGHKEAFSLKIEENPGVSSTPILPETSVRRPCYVADMRRAVPDKVHQMEFQHLEGPGDRHVIYWNGHEHEMSVESTHEQKKAGQSTHPFIDHWEVGTLHEIHANGQMKHPGHFHVNPFQIASVLHEETEFAKPDNYFQTGDFHDTIFIPTMKPGYESLVLRMQADRHVGKMALHCHFLAHEDDGMMAYIEISGTEGTVCKQVKELEPSCYEDAFEPMTQ